MNRNYNKIRDCWIFLGLLSLSSTDFFSVNCYAKAHSFFFIYFKRTLGRKSASVLMRFDNVFKE